MGFAKHSAWGATVALCFATAALGFVAVGCGSSGPGTTAGTTAAGSGGSTAAGGGGRHARETPIQSRGIKGENPTTEAEGHLHISAADCAALAGIAEKQTGTKLTREATPKPPLSRCRLDGHGVSISIYLDNGFAAAQRYSNRIEETVQFGEDPSKVPHPVPHVGDKAAYNADASWIPALRSLLAVRGNRWLTVTLSVAGHSNRRLRDEAAVLARAGFKLTASG
jgi:hypothetical protein